ncbi:MAG TPA: hypothetical protein VIJ57_09615 [Hanamia sp.]
MRKPTRNSHGTQPNKPIHKAKTFPTRNIQGISAGEENNQKENISHPHQSVIHKKYWPLTVTDTIALGMLIVTAALMWFTYGLYNSAVKDSKTADTSAYAANKSAITSQQTLNEIKDYNTKSLAKQQAALDSGFKRDAASVSLQMRNLTETQKDFEIESRPFVTVGNVVVDTPYLKKSIRVVAQIVNSGKQPAYIINTYYDWRFDPDTGFTSMKNIKHQASAEQSVIVGGGGTIPIWTNTIAIDSARLEYYKTHPLYCYVRAVIIYRGFSKKKVYKTALMFRIILKTDKDAKTVFYKAS